MENTNQNQTQSEVPLQEVSDEFDKSIQFLSELPTDKAMKEMSRMNYVPDSVRKVVETMALRKKDFIHSLRLMHIREKSLLHFKEAHRVMSVADKAIADFIEKNPDYNINIVAK